MKKLTIITTTLAFSFAPFHTISAHAEEQDKKGKGQKGKEKAQGGGGNAGGHGQAVRAPQVQTPTAHVKGGAPHSPPANIATGNPAAGRTHGARAVQPSPAFVPPNPATVSRAPRYVRPIPAIAQGRGFPGRGNSAQVYPDQGSYTRSNNYGGLWNPGDNHRGWDRNGVHVWNQHRYGWYDGGWLIIDGGFRPSGFTYSDYSSDSTVARVQRRLTSQGYRPGSADGVIGPATSNAISEYQQDYGLAVTGRINDPLLVSLGLE